MDTDMEIDPEIAAMMGFGSFGGNKKRKFGADDAFTDAQSGQQQESQQVASKANAIPVAEARSRPVVPVQAPPPGELPLLTFHLHYFYEWILTVPVDATRDNPRDNITLPDGNTMSLQALRRGIRNERGDMAYFLPSFLEDPWEKLVAKQAWRTTTWQYFTTKTGIKPGQVNYMKETHHPYNLLDWLPQLGAKSLDPSFTALSQHCRPAMLEGHPDLHVHCTAWNQRIEVCGLTARQAVRKGASLQLFMVVWAVEMMKIQFKATIQL
jgi:hypothetical protein